MVAFVAISGGSLILLILKVRDMLIERRKEVKEKAMRGFRLYEEAFMHGTVETISNYRCPNCGKYKAPHMHYCRICMPSFESTLNTLLASDKVDAEKGDDTKEPEEFDEVL